MRAILGIFILAVNGAALASHTAYQGGHGPMSVAKETEKSNPLLRVTDAQFKPVAEFLLSRRCTHVVFVNRNPSDVSRENREAQGSCPHSLKMAVYSVAGSIQPEKGEASLGDAILDPRVYQRAVKLLGQGSQGKKR